MNAFKFNGQAGSLIRIAICDYLKIPYHEIYKKVKEIYCGSSIIVLDNGDKYKITLEKIK